LPNEAFMAEEDACAPDPWTRCGPWIEAALARSGGTWTLDDAKAAVARGEMALWAAERCAFLTHVAQTPRMAVFDVVAAGGALDAILELVPGLIEAARRMGCGRITAAGRGGWLRALENTGFTDAWVVVAKDL
jgi:hypothetical protein